MYLYIQYLQGTETEQARNRAAYFRQFAAHLSVPVTGELGCGRMKSFADSSAVGVHWEQVDRYLHYLDYLNIYNTTYRTGRRPTTVSWSPTRLPTGSHMSPNNIYNIYNIYITCDIYNIYNIYSALVAGDYVRCVRDKFKLDI